MNHDETADSTVTGNEDSGLVSSFFFWIGFALIILFFVGLVITVSFALVAFTIFFYDITSIDLVLGIFIQAFLGVEGVDDAIAGTIIWFIIALALLFLGSGFVLISMRLDKSVKKEQKVQKDHRTLPVKELPPLEKKKETYTAVIDPEKRIIACSCGKEYPLDTVHKKCINCGTRFPDK